MESPTAPLDLTLSDLEMSNSRSLTFRNLISRKRAYLDPKLPLNTNRKPYMGSPMAHLHLFDLSKRSLKVTKISGQSQKSPTLQSLVSRKGAKLGHMLLLTINRKLYMASPMTP